MKYTRQQIRRPEISVARLNDFRFFGQTVGTDARSIGRNARTDGVK